MCGFDREVMSLTAFAVIRFASDALTSFVVMHGLRRDNVSLTRRILSERLRRLRVAPWAASFLWNGSPREKSGVGTLPKGKSGGWTILRDNGR